MIHSELCSACGGPLKLGVELVLMRAEEDIHSGIESFSLIFNQYQF